jgi:ABC-2 type transport system ATP-binding protein
MSEMTMSEMTMSEITMSVRGLRKTIGKREIIKGIDFSLHRGEVFGFLGPNGSGKTTTIRMLVGLIEPTAGTIEVCGYNLKTQFTKAIRNLGCIVENPELYGFLSGRDNLQYFARMIDGVDEARIEEVVQLVGLQARINDLVKTYSLGMRQRLGIAQALLNRPKVLILDEPTNGLDPAGIREMREFVRYLADHEGLTVFVSSHLLSEVQLLCDRVAIISKGTVIHVTEVRALLEQNERIYWHLQPQEQAKTILATYFENVISDGNHLVTAFDEAKIDPCLRALLQHNISVIEMSRKLSSLEELFLELTGGESID